MPTMDSRPYAIYTTAWVDHSRHWFGQFSYVSLWIFLFSIYYTVSISHHSFRYINPVSRAVKYKFCAPSTRVQVSRDLELECIDSSHKSSVKKTPNLFGVSTSAPDNLANRSREASWEFLNTYPCVVQFPSHTQSILGLWTQNTWAYKFYFALVNKTVVVSSQYNLSKTILEHL